AALRAQLPSVRYEPLSADSLTPRLGVEYRATTEHRPLRVDTVAMASGLLASLQPLQPGEQGMLQWLLTPAGPVRPPGLAPRRRLLPQRLVAERIAWRALPLTRYPIVLNVEEAAGLIGWPVGLRAVPGLPLGGCRLLPVAAAIADRGTVLGTATFPGQAGRAVALDQESRFRPL